MKGLGFILKLRPVTYNTDNMKLEEYLTRNFPDSIQRRYRDVIHPGFIPVRKTGFIAQEVEAAAKEAGYDFDGVKVPQNENDVYGLTYGQFVVPLVKAVQEQQSIIEDLKTKNDDLQNTNIELLKKYDELQRQIDEIKASLKK